MNRAMLVVLAVLVLTPSTAVADRGSRDDGDDSGSQRVWDIAAISHSHIERDQTRLLRHTVSFYDDVSNTNFDEGYSGSGITFYFEFNDEKAGPERTAYFGRNEDESLFVSVADRRGRVRAFANWFQPSPEEVSIEFPSSALGRGAQQYKWKVEAISGPPCEADGSPADGCPDESRWLKHLLN